MPAADLHFHILPGVDDGPADLGESLELARAAVAEGTRTVVATPHVRLDLGITDAWEIHERVHELRWELSSEGIELELRCGGELGDHMVERLGCQELDLLAQGPPGARWVLVETPFEGVGPGFHQATDELRRRGFGVLIAHPERSADATLDDAIGLRRELEAGSLAQINAQSLTGDHGHDAQVAAFRLIEDGLVAVVASDAHGLARPPALAAARTALMAGGVSEVRAHALVGSGPWRLLDSGTAARAAVAA
jgi:protein-tyrosine phosphatase